MLQRQTFSSDQKVSKLKFVADIIINILIFKTTFMQDPSYWVPYVTASLIILFIIFFCGGPGMYCLVYSLTLSKIQYSALHTDIIREKLHWIISLFHKGGATPTLSSELFIQSDRLAALVLMGLQRWFMIALLGLVFPFLIVSAAKLKISNKLSITHVSYLYYTLLSYFSLTGCSQLVLLYSVCLYVPAGLSLHLLPSAWDERQDHAGDIRDVWSHHCVWKILLEGKECGDPIMRQSTYAHREPIDQRNCTCKP